MRAGMRPDSISFTSALGVCLGIEDRGGKQVHAHIVRTGFESCIFVGSDLLNMYAKCRSMEEENRVFNNMSKRNVVSWIAMILGYAQNGQGEESLRYKH